MIPVQTEIRNSNSKLETNSNDQNEENYKPSRFGFLNFRFLFGISLFGFRILLIKLDSAGCTDAGGQSDSVTKRAVQGSKRSNRFRCEEENRAEQEYEY